MWHEYLATVAVLLFIYGLFRTVYWWESRAWRESGARRAAESRHDRVGTGIDALGLRERLEHAREKLTEVHARRDSFKHARLVEQRREEIARRELLQRPPAEPAPEEERHYLLVV